MIVVTLIGLLATLVGTTLWRDADEAKRRIALVKCKDYYDATYTWMMFQRLSNPPNSLDALEQPLRSGDRPYKRLEPDPWGVRYRIERENARLFRIWSNGPDTEPGTDDDICYEPLDE